MDIIIKRPLVLLALSLITGITVASTSGSLFMSAAFLIFLGVCMHLVQKAAKYSIYILIGILVFYSLGAFEFLCLDMINAGRFEDYSGEQIAVRGFIASEPEIKENRVSYVVNVNEIRSNKDFVKKNGKLLLTSAMNSSRLLDYGREVEFAGRLELPKGVRNPGGFDYRRYLSQKGVSAVVFAMDYNINAGKDRSASFLINTGRMLRLKIVGVIEKSLPRQQAGLLNGILIGYRDGLTEEVKDAFSDAGLTHIMAVSGANVAFLVLPLVFIFKKLRIRQNISCILTIAFLVLFVYITGFEPSVLRAVLMGIIILLGKILMRESDVYSAVALAAIILLLCSPYMLFSIGFQLSFAATLSLVMLNKRIKELLSFKYLPAAAKDVLAATLAAQLGVLPVTVYYFNKLSVISLISNLLVVPLIEIITILGMAMAVFGQLCIIFSQLLGYVNCLLLSFVLFVTKVSSEIPFATIRLVTPSIIMVVIYYSAVWFLLWYAPRRKIKVKLRYIAAAVLMAATLMFASFLIPGKLEVTFIDVGEGDSALISTYSGQKVLIDGGGSTNPQVLSAVGESVVIPFLLDKGISQLDAVIASHGHTDHIQGLLPVLEQFKVKNLIIPYVQNDKEFTSLLKAAGEKSVKIRRCSGGDIIILDRKTVFQVMNPKKEFCVDNSCEDNSSLNNTSLVLKLIYGETEVLFTGDAETEIEEELLKRNAPLKSDVIKISHHGSDTSTSIKFLDSVCPDAAVISVGKNNFGHPSPVVLQRLEEKGIMLFRTDECGAVVLTSNGKSIRIGRTVGGTD